MGRHVVRLPSGQRFALEVPAEVTFDPPIGDADQVRRAIAKAIAAQVEPLVQRRPTVKSVLRDSNGRISGLSEVDGDPPERELAWRVGREMAEFFLPVEPTGPEAK